jgi:hypothetical protein
MKGPKGLEPFVICSEKRMDSSVSEAVKWMASFEKEKIKEAETKLQRSKGVDWAVLDYEEGGEEEKDAGTVKRELVLTYDDGLSGFKKQIPQFVGWGAVMATVDSDDKKVVQELFYARTTGLEDNVLKWKDSLPEKEEDAEEFETFYREHFFHAFDGNETLRVLYKHLKSKTAIFLGLSAGWWGECRSSNRWEMSEDFNQFAFATRSVSMSVTEAYLELFFSELVPEGFLKTKGKVGVSGKEKENKEEKEEEEEEDHGLNGSACKNVIYYWLSSVNRLTEKRTCDYLLGDYGTVQDADEMQKAMHAFDLFAQDVMYSSLLPRHLNDYSQAGLLFPTPNTPLESQTPRKRSETSKDVLGFDGSAREMLTGPLSDWWAFACLKRHYFDLDEINVAKGEEGRRVFAETERIEMAESAGQFEGSIYESIFRKTSNENDGKYFSRRYSKTTTGLNGKNEEILKLLDFVLSYHVKMVVYATKGSESPSKELRYAIWNLYKEPEIVESIFRLLEVLYEGSIKIDLAERGRKKIDKVRREENVAAGESFENRIVLREPFRLAAACKVHLLLVKNAVTKLTDAASKLPLFLMMMQSVERPAEESGVASRSSLIETLLKMIKERQSGALSGPKSYPCVGRFGFENVLSESTFENEELPTVCDLKYMAIIKAFLNALDGYRATSEEPFDFENYEDMKKECAFYNGTTVLRQCVEAEARSTPEKEEEEEEGKATESLRIRLYGHTKYADPKRRPFSVLNLGNEDYYYAKSPVRKVDGILPTLGSGLSVYLDENRIAMGSSAYYAPTDHENAPSNDVAGSRNEDEYAIRSALEAKKFIRVALCASIMTVNLFPYPFKSYAFDGVGSHILADRLREISNGLYGLNLLKNMSVEEMDVFPNVDEGIKEGAVFRSLCWGDLKDVTAFARDSQSRIKLDRLERLLSIQKRIVKGALNSLTRRTGGGGGLATSGQNPDDVVDLSEFYGWGSGETETESALKSFLNVGGQTANAEGKRRFERRCEAETGVTVEWHAGFDYQGQKSLISYDNFVWNPFASKNVALDEATPVTLFVVKKRPRFWCAGKACWESLLRSGQISAFGNSDGGDAIERVEEAYEKFLSERKGAFEGENAKVEHEEKEDPIGRSLFGLDGTPMACNTRGPFYGSHCVSELYPGNDRVGGGGDGFSPFKEPKRFLEFNETSDVVACYKVLTVVLNSVENFEEKVESTKDGENETEEPVLRVRNGKAEVNISSIFGKESNPYFAIGPPIKTDVLNLVCTSLDGFFSVDASKGNQIMGTPNVEKLTFLKDDRFKLKANPYVAKIFSSLYETYYDGLHKSYYGLLSGPFSSTSKLPLKKKVENDLRLTKSLLLPSSYGGVTVTSGKNGVKKVNVNEWAIKDPSPRVITYDRAVSRWMPQGKFEVGVLDGLIETIGNWPAFLNDDFSKNVRQRQAFAKDVFLKNSSLSTEREWKAIRRPLLRFVSKSDRRGSSNADEKIPIVELSKFVWACFLERRWLMGVLGIKGYFSKATRDDMIPLPIHSAEDSELTKSGSFEELFSLSRYSFCVDKDEFSQKNAKIMMKCFINSSVRMASSTAICGKLYSFDEEPSTDDWIVILENIRRDVFSDHFTVKIDLPVSKRNPITKRMISETVEEEEEEEDSKNFASPARFQSAYPDLMSYFSDYRSVFCETKASLLKACAKKIVSRLMKRTMQNLLFNFFYRNVEFNSENSRLTEILNVPCFEHLSFKSHWTICKEFLLKIAEKLKNVGELEAREARARSVRLDEEKRRILEEFKPTVTAWNSPGSNAESTNYVYDAISNAEGELANEASRGTSDSWWMTDRGESGIADRGTNQLMALCKTLDRIIYSKKQSENDFHTKPKDYKFGPGDESINDWIPLFREDRNDGFDNLWQIIRCQELSLETCETLIASVQKFDDRLNSFLEALENIFPDLNEGLPEEYDYFLEEEVEGEEPDARRFAMDRLRDFSSYNVERSEDKRMKGVVSVSFREQRTADGESKKHMSRRFADHLSGKEIGVVMSFLQRNTKEKKRFEELSSEKWAWINETFGLGRRKDFNENDLKTESTTKDWTEELCKIMSDGCLAGINYIESYAGGRWVDYGLARIDLVEKTDVTVAQMEKMFFDRRRAMTFFSFCSFNYDALKWWMRERNEKRKRRSVFSGKRTKNSFPLKEMQKLMSRKNVKTTNKAWPLYFYEKDEGELVFDEEAFELTNYVENYILPIYKELVEDRISNHLSSDGDNEELEKAYLSKMKNDLEEKTKGLYELRLRLERYGRR